MVMVSSLGPMEEISKETTSMTEKKATVNFNGLMEELIRDNGSMENNMVKANTQVAMGSLEQVDGKMVKELNGLKILDFNIIIFKIIRKHLNKLKLKLN